MKRVSLSAIALAGILLPASGPTHAIGDLIIEVDLTGWQTWGGLGSANNTVVNIDMDDLPQTFPIITGIGWDLTIESIGGSWNSEVAFDIDGGVLVTPGTGQTGTGSYSSGGIIKLIDANISDIIIDDGIITIEAFETFDDPNNTDTGQVQDANISGSLFLQFVGPVVPAPAVLCLLAVPVAAANRRRRTTR